MSIAVNSFTKKTDGTGTQTVAHGLGLTPKAIIFFAIDKTATGFSVDHIMCMGFTDGVDDGCLGIAAEDNLSPGTPGKGLSNTKCVRFVDDGQVVVAEAHLDSWDGTNFVLDWTTNNASAYHIGFLAISGDSTVEAKVLFWDGPTTTGNHAETGVGFQPDLLLHLGHLSTTYNDAAGGRGFWGINTATDEFVLTQQAEDNDNSSASIFQKSTHIHAIASTVEVSNHVSFDADGFTQNFTTASGSARKFATLCLKGLSAKLGSFDKSIATAPVDQQITGIGFKPSAILLMSAGKTALDSITDDVHNSFGIADPINEFCIHWSNEDAVVNTDVDGLVKTDKALVLCTGFDQTVDAEADLKGMTSDGFDLTWTTNDANAYKIVYLALHFPVYKDYTDTITITEGIRKFELKPVSDEISVIDTIETVIDIAEFITVSDELTVTKLINILETIGVTDAVNMISSIVNVTDTIGVTDDLAKIISVDDLISIADAINKIKTDKPQDTVTVQDSVEVFKKSVNTFSPGRNILILPRRKRTFILKGPKKEN